MESDDKIKNRLITQTNNFCLTALDQTLGACSQKGAFAQAAERLHIKAERALEHVLDMRMCLPRNHRVPFDPWLEIAAMNPWCVCPSR